MASAVFPQTFIFRAFSQSGGLAPLAGGMLYFYEAGTTTPQAAYTDTSGTVPLPNPLQLDANGSATFCLLATKNYKINLTDINGVTQPGYPIDNIVPDDALSQLASTAPGQGASLIGYLAPYTGAVGRLLNLKLAETISVKDFGAVGDGVTDDTAAIALALSYAASLVVNNANVDSQQAGGVRVWIPRGIYIISDTLIVAPGVSLIGAGKTSTVIQNLTTNKTLIRNSLGAVYNSFGTVISDLALYGARTSPAQYGLDILRGLNCQFRNIYIQNCGASGLRVRQCITCTFDQIDSELSVGAGIWVGGGVNSWSDSTPNTLPTNNCRFVDCHAKSNDGAGLYFDAYVNGCMVQGGAYEYNYYSSGNNIGYNIELRNTGSFMANEFTDLWTEGPGQCHVYKNAADTYDRFTRWHHFGNGPTGTVDRAAICVAGGLLIDSSYGHGASYKTIGGSIAPFRLTKATTGTINLDNPRGSTLTDAGPWVEDETNAVSGFYNYCRQNNRTWTYGDQVYRSADNGTNARWYNETAANPAIQVDVYNRNIKYGDSSIATLVPIPNLGNVAGTTTIPSANTIAPTEGLVQISGATTIKTITPPYSGFRGVINIIPATGSTWVTDLTGNIALATTAVPNKLLVMAYDATSAKWYPSY